MSQRVKATIAPTVLTWARRTAGYEPDEAAAKIGVDLEKITSWEIGKDQPSIPQLRKLAELYKRPLAVLYLPEPPMNFQAMHDFRRLPEGAARRFSPGLMLEVRRAQQRRTLALELFDDAEIQPRTFEMGTTEQAAPEDVGRVVRQALEIDYQTQSHWGEGLNAFRHWRTQIETRGVLVFQASRFGSEEASGFAYWAPTLPVIVVNRKDAYPRRTFSLLHELAHLMLRQSGISDLDVEAPRTPADARIEVFCNQVAAATLMPRMHFLAEPAIADRGAGRHDWPEEAIGALAHTYGVSREAIVRRLLTFGRTTEAFYSRKRTQYLVEFQALKTRQRAEAKEGDGIPRNMPRETIADFGRPFVRAVIENYHQDRLTLSDVSGYLGVKVRHIPTIEQQVGLG